MNDKVEQVFLETVAKVVVNGDIDYVLENKEEKCFLEAIGAESLDNVKLVMALEDTFDINITDEELEDFVKMSCDEMLHMLESAGASAESMRRARAQKETSKPVEDKKQAQESSNPGADKKQVQESQNPGADKKQAQESPKPVTDKEQTQKMEFKTILHQAENLVASIKLFESAQNNITAPSKQQPKPAIELRTMKDGKPYCELLGKKCNRPERPNNTGKVYCEFMNCRIYNNFQRLR